MKQFEVGYVHFLTTALTFSEIVHLCHSAVPISNVLSTILTQYMDNLSISKRTDSHSAADNGVVESREPPIYGGGGYGGGGGGKGWGSGGGGGYDGGGNGHGAITLDPVSIISLLALGAFLINNILQLLRANAAPAPAPAPAVPPGRSLNLDINVPMDIRDFGSIMGKMDYNRRSSGKRSMSDNNHGEPSFSQFFENVGSLYYLHPKKRNICIKKVVCGYVNAQQSRESHQGTLKTRIFDLMLSTITKFVAPEIGENAKQELCHEFNKLCSDTILHDAKISTENKVYGHDTCYYHEEGQLKKWFGLGL